MVWNQEWYSTVLYLKVIGLLPGLEDGLEPFLDDLSFRTFHLLWVTLRTSSLQSTHVQTWNFKKGNPLDQRIKTDELYVKA
jgi:hypothetical protein